MVNSVEGIKSGDASVVIGYQVDNLFTPGWQSALFHGQGVNTYPLFTQTKLWRLLYFWTMQLKNLSMVLILSSWILSTHQNLGILW